MCSPVNYDDLAVQLYDVGAVKFGSFKLKSGVLSPIYFDLRVIISYPHVLKQVAEVLQSLARDAIKPYQSVCGVPYTALPIATLMSVHDNTPMLIRRKEAKDYGTKKLIEGHYKENEVCLVVEDVVTSGSSVRETAEALMGAGIQVHDAVVLLNREQGGKENLKTAGINLHSALTISQLMNALEKAGRVNRTAVEDVRAFINGNQIDSNLEVPPKKVPQPDQVVLDYITRASMTSHPIAKKIFQIMHEKKSNLCLSADICSSQKLLEMADAVGPYICMLKTHVDILDDFTENFSVQLVSLAQKHNFVIFEDRKFADIGNTVTKQFGGGVYKINDWADVINAHILPGPGIIKGLREANKKSGCLLLAEMSSEGNYLKPEYTKEAVRLAEENKDFVIGFICTSRVSDDPSLIHFTPGVHLSNQADSKGQRYLTPSKLLEERKVDVLIVGRGIIEAEDPVQAAKDYAAEGYKGYLALTGQ